MSCLGEPSFFGIFCCCCAPSTPTLQPCIATDHVTSPPPLPSPTPSPPHPSPTPPQPQEQRHCLCLGINREGHYARLNAVFLQKLLRVNISPVLQEKRETSNLARLANSVIHHPPPPPLLPSPLPSPLLLFPLFIAALFLLSFSAPAHPASPPPSPPPPPHHHPPSPPAPCPPTPPPPLHHHQRSGFLFICAL